MYTRHPSRPSDWSVLQPDVSRWRELRQIRVDSGIVWCHRRDISGFNLTDLHYRAHYLSLNVLYIPFREVTPDTTVARLMQCNQEIKGLKYNGRAERTKYRIKGRTITLLLLGQFSVSLHSKTDDKTAPVFEAKSCDGPSRPAGRRGLNSLPGNLPGNPSVLLSGIYIYIPICYLLYLLSDFLDSHPSNRYN